jgi:hypothetical protein
MHPLGEPATPGDWPRSRPTTRIVLSAVFLAVLTLGALAAAARAAAIGDRTAAIWLGAGTVYLGHVVGVGVGAWFLPRRGGRSPAPGRTDNGEPGLAFPFRRAPAYWIVALILMTVLVLLAWAVALAAGGPVGWLLAVLTALPAGYLIRLVVAFLRFSPGRLVLAPDGVYHRSQTFEHFVPWHAVSGVVAAPDRIPMLVIEAHPGTGIRLRGLTGMLGGHEAQMLPNVAVRALWLGAFAIDAYRAADYYFRHPDRRADLGTPAVVENIRRSVG